MALKSHELKQRMKKIEYEQKSILDEAVGALSTEQEQKFDALQNEFNKIHEQVRKVEMLEQREISENESTRAEEKAWKPGDLKPEQKKEAERLAMQEYILKGRIETPELKHFMKPAKNERDDSSMIARELSSLGITRLAQQSTTDGSGGYTIPTGFSNELEIAMKQYGPVLQSSRVWRTASGNVIDWPMVNDTANRAYLLSEATSAETSAVQMVDQNKQFEAYKLTSGLLRVSSELVQDSAFNITQVVLDFLAERIGRGINYYATLGDGSSKPKGVVVGAAAGNNTANDTALAFADFINLEHEVDPAYRPSAAYMFHDSVLASIKKLVDVASGTPLWQPSFRDGEPARLNGYRYWINQDMATFTDGAATSNDNKKIALFGDFSKHLIRLAGDIRIVRLNERFGDTDEIGLVAFVRMDSEVLDAGTHPIKYMRVSAT
jgi:HK97 family phage major capsid protein